MVALAREPFGLSALKAGNNRGESCVSQLSVQPGGATLVVAAVHAIIRLNQEMSRHRFRAMIGVGAETVGRYLGRTVPMAPSRGVRHSSLGACCALLAGNRSPWTPLLVAWPSSSGLYQPVVCWRA